MSRPDPVTVEIIRQAFASAAREMHQGLIRGAYSPIIYEMQDCSVGVFDVDGQLLGQSPGLPLFIGGLDHAVRVVKARFSNSEPGDAYAVNDSFEVGSHLNDVTVVAPAFHENELVGWSAAKGHWQDVGAKNPGETADSSEIYQEGIRFKPIRVMARGEWVTDVVNLLRWNSRTPRTLMGDLSAQVAACRMGERRLADGMRRFGRSTLEAARDDFFRQAEEAEIAFIRTIPSGVYEADGFLDGDGQTEDPVPIRLQVVVEEEDITFDLSGSSPQRPGNTNCGLAQTISAARLAFQYIMHSQEQPNGGSFKHLHVIAPKGSVFDATLPAACMMYGSAPGMMINLVLRALASAIPERVIAGQPDSASNVIITGRYEDGSLFVTGEATALGWGARFGMDGGSAFIDSMGGDLKNHPTETMEAKRPVLIHAYRLREDSCGPGRWRGGLGVEKVYEIRHPKADLTLWFEREKLPGWGLFGGQQGASPEVHIVEERSDRYVLRANHIPVSHGTMIYARTGGGGGYGPPWQRDPDEVLADVRRGYVSRASAERDYGVVLHPGRFSIDHGATEVVRRDMREAWSGEDLPDGLPSLSLVDPDDPNTGVDR